MTFEEQQAVIEHARRERAALLIALARSAAGALWRPVLVLQRTWAASRTRDELRALSDRTLKDIGLDRGRIESLFR
jgi:uncharacterized protein YjiS (DUF1127 family)